MTEKEVCTKIVNTFLSYGHEAFKIPDMPRTPGTKFNRPKGYDISASVRYNAILIEAKLRKTKALPKSLSTFRNQFTPHQLTRFDRVTKAGNAHCYAFVVCYHSSPIYSERLHNLYIIDWIDIAYKKYKHLKYEPLKTKKGLYDLEDFFNIF